MDPDSSNLFQELRRAGLSASAIRAAWPSWWSDEVAASPSGRAELRFALARKLGLDPKPLLGERVEFVWKDNARFKHLSTQDSSQQAILSSFGVSVGRLLLRATPAGPGLAKLDAAKLRASILQTHTFVGLGQLLSACWALGVPVIQLRVFPLATKSMHAMVVESGGRYAVLLGRDASYPAPVAFTLAHEMGHAAHEHLDGAAVLVDMEDPAQAKDRDQQESEADAFALTLLTGSPDPVIETSLDSFNSRTLANAVLAAGPQYGIEPGTMALCVAFRKNLWPTAMASMHYIYSEAKPVWKEVNAIAARMIDWESVGDEAADYLNNIMQTSDD